MKKTFKFPKDFMWGSAIAGAQVESGTLKNTGAGGKGETIWDHAYRNYKEKFHNEKFVVNDFHTNYKTDVQALDNLNMNSVRYSIQWARLFPEGMDKVNQEGVDFYHKVFKEVKDKSMKLIVNLYHFDMPMWAQRDEEGGWNDRATTDAYAKYAKFVIKEYPEIDMITTMNEPTVPAECGYLYECHYPFVKSFKKSYNVLWNTLIAHLKAAKEIKSINPEIPFGIILNVAPALARSESPEDQEAAKWSDMFDHKIFVDPIIKHEFPIELKQIGVELGLFDDEKIFEQDMELIRDESLEINFLGVNFYGPNRVKSVEGKEIDWKNNSNFPSNTLFEDYDMPGRRMNTYRGWEIYPQALYGMLINVRDNYKNLPVYISENGMGVEGEDRFRGEDGIIQDTYRINFFEEHLYWIYKALEDGVNVFGFHMWTYIDNWSWLNAYKNRYGFIELDIETGKRQEKLSATWIRKTIEKNEITVDEQIIIDGKITY